MTTSFFLFLFFYLQMAEFRYSRLVIKIYNIYIELLDNWKIIS